MNDDRVSADDDESEAKVALPPLIALAFAPLMVKSLTVRCKVQPNAWAYLDQAAREVNQVWNFANATCVEALTYWTMRSMPPSDNPNLGKPKVKKEQNVHLDPSSQSNKIAPKEQNSTDHHNKNKPSNKESRWLSAYDLNRLVSGCGETFSKIGIDVAQKVCGEFAQKRTQFKKAKLRFRASGGSKKALGWIPFKVTSLRQKGNSLTFYGKRIRLFNAEYYFAHRSNAIKIREGSFSQNALGEWFLNQVMDVAFAPLPPLLDRHQKNYAIGMDPGKDVTLSTGEKLLYGFYRDAQDKLAQLQKNGRKKQAKYLHNDIKNKRLNQQHQDTTRLIREHGEIYIGDNSVVRMKQKNGSVAMGKSISDNAIGQFKTLLSYKGHWAGRKVVLVSERYTTQVCSSCGQNTGPKGLKQLAVRWWSCSACGAEHDRDINAAVNMLTAEVSVNNDTIQPRSGLLFAETR